MLRFLVEALHASDDAEEFSTGTVLEYVVEFSLALEGGVEFDDEGVGALGLGIDWGTSMSFSM